MKKLILIGLLPLSIHATAQQIICTAASNGSEVAWTIGEILTETIAGENLIVSQGFNQTDDTNVGIEKPSRMPEYKIYPNPVINKLSIANPDLHDLSWTWTDMSGICLESGKSADRNIELNVSPYPVGKYILTISSSDGEKSIIILKKEQ